MSRSATSATNKHHTSQVGMRIASEIYYQQNTIVSSRSTSTTGLPSLSFICVSIHYQTECSHVGKFSVELKVITIAGVCDCVSATKREGEVIIKGGLFFITVASVKGFFFAKMFFEWLQTSK